MGHVDSRQINFCSFHHDPQMLGEVPGSIVQKERATPTVDMAQLDYELSLPG